MTERLITSLTNDTVKAVRALHMRKERETTGTFLAEGLKFIGEALDQGRAPRMLLVGQDARPHPLLDRAKAETIKAGGEYRTYTFDTFQARVLDMESAAVAQVAYVNRVPFIAFRSLSDLAGGGEGENQMATFFQLAADNAAAVVRAFVRGLP